MKYLFTLVFIGLLSNSFAQDTGEESKKKDTKTKVFFSFDGKRSFLHNDTKYFGFDFGMKAKCKYKIGFGYSWLRGTYKTDLFPVSTEQYPDAKLDTRTDIKFYSVLFEPIVFREKKLNESMCFFLQYNWPLHELLQFKYFSLYK